MPPAPMNIPAGAGQPSTFDKMKMGATMGTVVGLSMGFIFGGFTVLRGGAGPKGPLHTMSQYMLSSAGTFGFFMAIGSVVRNDSPESTLARQGLTRMRIASEREGAAWLRIQQARARGSSEGRI